MKTLKVTLLAAMMFGALTGFAQTKKAEWKEQKDFHAVMGATFHPTEEGNYEPIKKRSGELAKAAVAWSKAAYPAGYDKKKIAPLLKKLVKEAQALDKLVKAKASDEKIGKSLTALHDRFHEITEKCNASGEEEHEHEH